MPLVNFTNAAAAFYWIIDLIFIHVVPPTRTITMFVRVTTESNLAIKHQTHYFLHFNLTPDEDHLRHTTHHPILGGFQLVRKTNQIFCGTIDFLSG